MVSAEAYTINEFVMYMIIMYVFVMMNLGVAYLTNKIQEKENQKKMYLSLGFSILFGILPFMDFRIGAIFFGIGAMFMMAIYNAWDAYEAYKESHEVDWYG